MQYWSLFVFPKQRFQQNVCNKCHDLLMMSKNLSNNAVLHNKSGDYCCIINRISKNELNAKYRFD